MEKNYYSGKIIGWVLVIWKVFFQGRVCITFFRRLRLCPQLKSLLRGFLLIKKITTWRVLENKIDIKVNMTRHGIVVDRAICCFCMEKEETTSHFFFECRIAWLVWNICYAWVGLNSADYFEPASHFLHFNLVDAPVAVNLAFENIWIALVRNKYIFKGEVIDHFEILSLAQLKVWSLGYFQSSFNLFFLF